jgi:hypothetical protein
MAARIAALGLVTVSERRSIILGRFGNQINLSSQVRLQQNTTKLHPPGPQATVCSKNQPMRENNERRWNSADGNSLLFAPVPCL